MLPVHRTEGEVFSIPQFELTPRDVDGFLDELRAFHHRFRGCFARSEPREHFFNYMVGQCSALERKSIEPMALQVQGGNIRGMQRCMSDDVWDEDTMSQALSKRARSQWEWRGSTVARWGRWKIVKWGYLPLMPHGRAMPWWIHGSSCQRHGLRKIMQTDGPSATCLMTSYFTPNRS